MPEKETRSLRKTILVDRIDDSLHALCVDPDLGAVINATREGLNDETVKVRVFPPVSDLFVVLVADIHIESHVPPLDSVISQTRT